MTDHTARQAVCPSGQDGHHRSQSSMQSRCYVLVVFLIKRLGRVSSTRMVIMFLLPLIIEPFFNCFLTVLLPYFDRSFTVFLPSGNHRTHRRTETVRSVL